MLSISSFIPLPSTINNGAIKSAGLSEFSSTIALMAGLVLSRLSRVFGKLIFDLLNFLKLQSNIIFCLFLSPSHSCEGRNLDLICEAHPDSGHTQRDDYLLTQSTGFFSRCNNRSSSDPSSGVKL